MGVSLSCIDNHLDTGWDGDGEVLEAACGGDRDALEALVTAHYDRVHALCRRMLGNDADALDATQDALLAAIRGLSRFNRRSSFGTWLYRIATNVCIDEMRRRRRRPVTGFASDVAKGADGLSSEDTGLFVVPTPGGARSSESSPCAEDGWQGAPQTAGRGGSGAWGSAGGGRDPADVAAGRVDVDAALAMLPVEFRTAVVLRDVCDLPYDEIAEILAVPVGTVRSRIARARSALAATWRTERGAPSGQPRDGATGNRAGSPDVRTNESDRASESDRAPLSDGSHPPQRHGRRPDPTTEKSQQEERTQ